MDNSIANFTQKQVSLMRVKVKITLTYLEALSCTVLLP